MGALRGGRAHGSRTRNGSRRFQAVVRTNVAIWGVGLAVEMYDGPAAVARTEGVVLPPSLPRARTGHHYLDLARGHFYNGDNARALDALMAARRITPQQIRYNPMARETVYAPARAERRSTATRRVGAKTTTVPHYAGWPPPIQAAPSHSPRYQEKVLSETARWNQSISETTMPIVSSGTCATTSARGLITLVGPQPTRCKPRSPVTSADTSHMPVSRTRSARML